MATRIRKVSLIGASGTVGSHILDALLEDPNDEFEIKILTRQDSQATFPTHPAVKVVKTNFIVPDLLSHLKGQDAIIHAGGIASLADEPLIIHAAVQAGVPRFILNEFANSYNQKGLTELERFRAPKLEILRLAQQSTNENPWFSWTGLATGNIIDYSLKKFPQFGIDIPNRKARLVDDGSERFSATTLPDIGAAVRGILRRPEETKNRMCHVRSVESCQAEILDAAKAEIQGDWDVQYENSKTMHERGRLGFEKGERSGMLDLLVVQLFQKGAGRSVVTAKEESDNHLLGVQEKDIRSIVQEVLRTFNQIDGKSKVGAMSGGIEKIPMPTMK